ncbi:MAG: hypothetical protein JRN54_07945 [Nitrososphaerota archaeon]|nr:hypothetical protein [Nitrososphaerota archaeon]
MMETDKLNANLDIFWLKDEAMVDLENLSAPEILAQEITENLEAALEQFRSVSDEIGDANQTTDPK